MCLVFGLQTVIYLFPFDLEFLCVIYSEINTILYFAVIPFRADWEISRRKDIYQTEFFQC